MTSATSSAPPESSGKFSIILFLLLGLAPLYWYMNKGRVSPMPAPAPAADLAPGPSGWYLAVKLPEAPFDEAGSEAYKKTLSAWLGALQREGFHPMLLSAVYDHTSHGIGLPDKTIVLTFEPAYGNTYRLAAPILDWYKMPAVWITNAAAVKRSNRKYVSNFRLWRMKLSGHWDVGFYERPGMLTIDSKNLGKLTLGAPSRPLWNSAGSVSHALNQSGSFHQMNRLKVSPLWSDRELVSRLLNEVPVTGTSQLTARQVGDRVWGMSIPGSAYTNSALSLKAPLDKRAVSVTWPGTRGLDDFDLQLDVSELVGELWLLARTDHDKGETVRIGFLQGLLVVETVRQGTKERLATTSGLPRHGKGFSAKVLLQGHELRVDVNGDSVVELRNIPDASSKAAMLELMVYNKIRGTASADGVRLILNPLISPVSSSSKA